jgi:NTE family protein
VLDDMPPENTLCFMVDLWSASGHEPTTLEEVQTRQKDVMFASRSRRHIDAYVRTHQLQRTLRSLYDQLPPDLKNETDEHVLSSLGCDTTMHIVHLPYGGQDWHMSAKDINFSSGSVQWRWDQGYNDALRSIAQAGWLAAVTAPSSIVLHALVPAPQD